MTFPPLTDVLAMYAINIGILWTATRFLASAENKPTVLRCLAAALVMTIFGNASHIYLNRLIGNWDIAVKLLAFVIAALAIFKLSLWRSCLIALIFYAGVMAQYFFLFGGTIK